MILKIFTQPNCPKCPPAKKLGRKLEKEMKVEYWNTASVDGLAEASFYSVLATPGLVLTDNQGKELKNWRGEVPSLEAIKKLLE